ncbi:MAG: ABC transporter permease [Gemmataceae bacterium]
MQILGPVFWYDLIRVARKQRFALWRAVYALVLLIILYFSYMQSFPASGLLYGQTIRQRSDLAFFATGFFGWFISVQLVAVIGLTPFLTATALAEERSKNTLDFLLTSQLRAGEILFGKLLTRLLQVLMLVLTGLPILALLQLFGGIDQTLMLCGFAATAVTALSMGSLGLLCAVLVKKPQNAVWRTYYCLGLYALISTGVLLIYNGPTGFPRMNVLAGGVSSEVGFWAEIREVLAIGNPYYALKCLEAANNRWLGPGLTVVPALLLQYSIVHCAFAILANGYALLRLRSLASKQMSGITKKKSLYLKAAKHPRIYSRPVLWKEMHCESKARQRWLGFFFSKWFFWASFTPLWIVLVISLEGRFAYQMDFVGGLLIAAGLLGAAGYLLRASLHAARAIGAERDRLTLDNLLVTDLDANEILREKWWGSLLAGRWVAIWLVVHWSLCVFFLLLRPSGLPLLVAELCAYAAFLVSVGMYFSVKAKTTKASVTKTLLTGFGGTTVLPFLLIQFFRILDPPPRSYDYLSSWQPREIISDALIPARIMFETAMPENSNYYIGYWTNHTVPAAFVCILVYGLLALAFWSAAQSASRKRFGVQRPRNLKHRHGWPQTDDTEVLQA